MPVPLSRSYPHSRLHVACCMLHVACCFFLDGMMRLPSVAAGENLVAAFFVDYILAKPSRSALDIAVGVYNFIGVDQSVDTSIRYQTSTPRKLPGWRWLTQRKPGRMVQGD